jgi:hypothetical protein
MKMVRSIKTIHSNKMLLFGTVNQYSPAEVVGFKYQMLL